MTEVAAEGTPPGVIAGRAPISFAAHQVRTGSEDGARHDFEQMIALLVKTTRPGARIIAANPGDWGIDVLVGELGGSVFIWQAKYLFPVTKKSHQRAIRESFKSAKAAAEEHGHAIVEWILCIPSSMDAETDKWWKTWKRRTENDSGVSVGLWDETELRTLLISPEADYVRREYYERSGATGPPLRDSGEADLRDLDLHQAEELESALFVRQLHAAGHQETTSAKAAFFNAELLAREIVDKAVRSEVNALRKIDMIVHGIWEGRFNDSCLSNDGVHLPGLHTTVMDAVRVEHSTLSKSIPCSVVHSWGMMHRVVEDRRAGWVRHWRSIAEKHSPGMQDSRAALNADDGQPAETSERTT